MKRVIITENQREIMENFFIFEADEAKKKNIKDFSEKLGQEFSKSLKNAKVNTGLLLLFGKTDNENKIIEESVVTYGTIVVDVDELNNMLVLAIVSVDYTQNSGSPILEPKTLIGIPFQNSIVVTASSCRLNCLSVSNYNPESKEIKYGRNKLVPDFLTFEIHGDISVRRLPSNGDENQPNDTIDTDYEEVKTEPLNNEEIKAVFNKSEEVKAQLRNKRRNLIFKWDERIVQILKSAEFTPGLFNMNNFFFFPKGYAVMDDILSKYGAHVDRVSKEGHNEYLTGGNIKFKLIDDSIKDENGTDLLAKDKTLVGTINAKRNYIAVTNNANDEVIALFYGSNFKPRVNTEDLSVKAYLLPQGEDRLNYKKSLNNGNAVKISILNIN
jgi:hypothetical protein